MEILGKCDCGKRMIEKRMFVREWLLSWIMEVEFSKEGGRVCME